MMLTGWDICECGHFRNAHHDAEGCCRTEWVRDEDDYTAEQQVICPCEQYRANRSAGTAKQEPVSPESPGSTAPAEGTTVLEQRRDASA